MKSDVYSPKAFFLQYWWYCPQNEHFENDQKWLWDVGNIFWLPHFTQSPETDYFSWNYSSWAHDIFTLFTQPTATPLQRRVSETASPLKSCFSFILTKKWPLTFRGCVCVCVYNHKILYTVYIYVYAYTLYTMYNIYFIGFHSILLLECFLNTTQIFSSSSSPTDVLRA